MAMLARLTSTVLLQCSVVGCVTTATEVVSTSETAAATSAVTEAASPLKTSQPPVKASRCFVERDGDFVVVHVIIDSKAEAILRRNILEGTAMLRTKACLRREFEELPKNFNLPSRRLKNEFDDDTGYYYYTTAFKLADIKKKYGR